MGPNVTEPTQATEMDAHQLAPVTTRVRYAAVDDHPAVAVGVSVLLTAVAPKLEFVGGSPSVAALLARDLRPDVVLLDLRLNDGSDATANMAALMGAPPRPGGAVDPPARPGVVVYTEGSDLTEGRRALAGGALSVVHKDRSVTVLAEAILAAAAGRTFPTTEMAALLNDEPWLRPQLSDQERESLRLYALNLPAKLVARRMGITEGTAKKYISRVRKKYMALGREAGTKMDLHWRALEDDIIEREAAPGATAPLSDAPSSRGERSR